jgi:hypothetical protein
MSAIPVDEVCSICQLGKKSRGSWIQLKKVGDLCGHFFHKKCLSQWLDTKASCPNCNRALLVERKVISPLMDKKVYQIYLAGVGILVCSLISLGVMGIPLIRSKVDVPIAELSAWMFALGCFFGGLSSEAIGAISQTTALIPSESEAGEYIYSRGRLQVIASMALSAISFATFFQGCLGSFSFDQKEKISYVGLIVGATFSSIVSGYGFFYGRQHHRTREEYHEESVV